MGEVKRKKEKIYIRIEDFQKLSPWYEFPKDPVEAYKMVKDLPMPEFELVFLPPRRKHQTRRILQKKASATPPARESISKSSKVRNKGNKMKRQENLSGGAV